jgi:hypothetical protein
MPTPTYDLIASNVLGSTSTSVTFSSLDTIGAGYRDLVLVCQTSSDSVQMNLRFNSDSGSNYNRVIAAGDGSATGSTTSTNSSALILGGDAQNQPSNPLLTIVSVFDFQTTDKHKSVLVRANQSATGVTMTAGRWASTAAITSLTILSGTNPFKVGSSFYLYGIVS